MTDWHSKFLWAFTCTVLTLVSVVSVPFGIFVGVLGLSGRLMDASEGENMEAALIGLAVGILPPALLLVLWLRRLPRRDHGGSGFPIEPTDLGS